MPQRKHPELAINTYVAQWVVQALTRLIATYAIGQGLGIIVGGRIRWSSAAYQDALTMPGAPGSWGVALFLIGIWTLAATFTRHHRNVTIAMAFLATWSGVFALFFASAAFGDHHASTTPIWVYGKDAVGCAVLAAAYWQSRQ